MALRTPDTRNEQDTSRNPSQEYYDREFNKIAGNAETAKNLKQQENQAGAGAGIDQAETYANDPANASRNIDKAKENEEAGGWKSNVSNPERQKGKAKFWGNLRRKGPLGAILGITAVMGGLGFSGLSLMPITIAEHFTNDTNDMAKSSQRKFVHLFGKKVNGSDSKKKLSICNSVVSFRCKMKTIPVNLAEHMEKQGKFKFHDKTVIKDSRIGFSALEFPDGIGTARDAGELTKLLDTPKGAAAFNSIYSFRNAPFLANWFSNVLRDLNLTKAKKIEGDTKAKADESFEASTKGEKGTVSTSAIADTTGEDATEEQRRAAQANTDAGNETSRQINEHIAKGTKLKRLSLKIGNALGIPQLACLTYNMANFVAVTAKVKKAMYFAGFAMIFLTLASSIKANTATEAEVAKGMDILAPNSYPAKVEDPVTGQMIDNPNIGKNALDAEAYKVVAYGDQINLTGIAAKFFIAGGFLGTLQKVITWINDNIGRSTIKAACKIVNSNAALVVSFLAAPIIGAAILGITQLLPVEEWAADLVNIAIDAAAGANFTTGIKGVDAGNVLFIGAAVIMGTAAMKFGLKPGKLDAIRKNMADNHELLRKEIAMKTYEASKTPLDITNRYSFLGSVAFHLASLMPNIEKPFVSSIGKTFSAIPQSFTMLTKNANAAYSMPVANYSDTRFSQCKDEVYLSLKDKFTPDMFCAVRLVPDGYRDSDVVFASLENSGEIDKTTAEPLPGTYAEKYMKYCVNRTDSWGSTSIAAEEMTEDPKWYTGEMCFGGERNNIMSEYVGYKTGEDIISSSPKIKDQEQAKQAFWAEDDSTFSAVSRGMSQMLEGAY